uniref:G-patch domain-containing protein n=1 Tax=Syphacia muris TaxID=451379 RepID=A0A0N5ABB3_9BILA
MGWTPGENFGKCCDGLPEAIAMKIKSDRKGLITTEDVIAKRQNSGVLYQQGVKAIVSGVEYQSQLLFNNKKSSKAQLCELVL